MVDSRRTDTAHKILDAAEALAQTCGFNGFSYADVAGRLGVTKPSLHYHFPSKADLGRALIVRYHGRFAQELERIDRETPEPPARLRRYVDLYHQVLRNDRLCLCGMFAAEYATLPGPMQEALRAFFDGNVTWLAGVLEAGRRSGQFQFQGEPRGRADLLLSTLEGALLIARAYNDCSRFLVVAQHLADSLGARSTAPPSP
ncbi:MAG: TetR/AcrR family transcriptional regulator [Holophaga sp.]